MKLFTDLKQSKKLVKILPLESADAWYGNEDPYKITVGKWKDNKHDEDDIPAWSLTALLGLMPPYLFEFERGIDLNIYPNLNGKGWHCSYMPNNIKSIKKDKFRQVTNGDNPVDAAFKMVCWLKENGKI